MEFFLFLIFLAIMFNDVPSTKDIERELKGIKYQLELLNNKKK